MSGERTTAYQFGQYRLDVAEQRLLHEGRVLPLTPKVFDVLRVLVQNSGHLVTKEQLLAEVWNDSFVEEGALSRSISILRKTLGENGSEQKYIETVPKRGYRFVAPVTEWKPTDAEVTGETTDRVTVVQAPHPSPPPSRTITKPDRTSRIRRWVLAITGVLVAALVPGLWRQRTRPTTVVTLPAPAPVHRQVTFTGREQAPTVSPDGRRIAYVSYEQPEKKLVVQALASGPALTIFTAPEIGYLRWSRDGTELIFWARGSGKNGVYLMSQFGGLPSLIAVDEFIGCWSPDGSTIAVAGYKGKIRFFDTRAREQRSVLLRDGDWSVWDLDWSAKDVLTFVTSDRQGRYTLWTMRADGSGQRRLLTSDSEIPTARWVPHSDAIYYLRKINQTFSLLKITSVPSAPDTQNATPVTIMAGLESDRTFALSGDGRRAVYARAPYYSNLWLVDTTDGRRSSAETRALTQGTVLIERPSVSPDGTAVAFNVGYEPTTNVFTMPIAGGPSKQLTFSNSLSLGAVWSADGKRIAFASRADGQPRVWAVDAAGGFPRPLSSTDLSDTFDLTWAPGSRILYQRSGNTNYYQLDPDTRSERLLLDVGSIGWMFSPVYSPDGLKIAMAWTRSPKPGIWVVDTRNHRETLVYPRGTRSMMPIGWSADGRFIYLVEGKNLNLRGLTAPNGETMTEARIVRMYANGDEVQTVLNLPFEEIGDLSMTPDGRKFVVAVYSSRSDVWVVDNFDTSP